MSNNIRYLLLLLPLLSSVHLQFSNALTIPKIKVEKVTTERCLTDQVKQEVMDIAVFRNKLVSAEMKIANQMEKRDTYDRTKSLLTGLSIGVVTGVGVGAATYMTTGDMQNSFENVMYVSSGIGLPLAISFGTGGKVFVMTDEQCRRGLLQDYVSGVWQDGDVAFVGKVRDYMNVNNGKYKPSNGVLASVDCQLRNSSSGKGSTTVYGTLPSHIHIKNMSVDEDLRGNGIASKLLEAIEKYAGRETDAELLTLYVDDSNKSAVRAYEKFGFEGESIASTGASKKYGTFTFGRSIMMKKIR